MIELISQNLVKHKITFDIMGRLKFFAHLPIEIDNYQHFIDIMTDPDYKNQNVQQIDMFFIFEWLL